MADANAIYRRIKQEAAGADINYRVMSACIIAEYLGRLAESIDKLADSVKVE